MFLDAGKGSARQEPYKPKSPALREPGAHHSPSILSTKRQRSIFVFANQVIWGASANVGL
jgi:hypothetical protein